MVKCNFCGDDLPLGGGKMYIKKEGAVFYFCSNKCEKNLVVLKRKPVKTRWTEQYNKLKKTMLLAKNEGRTIKEEKAKREEKVEGEEKVK